MQSENSKYYYCFQCKKTILLQTIDLLCTECGSDFLQEAKMPEPEASQSPGIPLDEFLTLFPHIFPNRPAGFNQIVEALRNRGSGSGRNIQNLLRSFIQLLNDPLPPNPESEATLGKEVVQVGPNDENECNICFSKFSEGEEKFVIECNHQFHVDCLAPWLKLNNLCPLCKKRVSL
jgi:E3 ubiquitin-protein ligase RNF115/126